MVAILGFSFSLSLHNLQPLQATPPTSVSSSLCHSQAQATNLIQLGKQSYQMGRFADAVNCWQQALTAYSDDFVKQAQISSQLSLAYQQMGQWKEAEEAIGSILPLLDSLPERTRAQVLNTQGRLLLATGKAGEAFETWQEAEKLYEESDNQKGVIGSQINQVTALQTLGRYRQALKQLKNLQETLETQPDNLLKARAYLSLGNALQAIGDLENSYCSLEKSLAITQTKILPSYQTLQGKVLLSLGNTAQALGKKLQQDRGNLSEGNFQNITKKLELVENCQTNEPSLSLSGNSILKSYQEAERLYRQLIKQTSTDITTKIQAQINLLILYSVIDKYLQATNRTSDDIRQSIIELLPQIKDNFQYLPINRNSIFSQINFSQTTIQLKKNKPYLADSELISWDEIENILTKANEDAVILQDQYAEAYTLGYLGMLYVKLDKLEQAREFTEKALIKAEAIQALEIIYQWQAQLGNIAKIKSPRDNNKAIKYYSAAVETLNKLREQNLVGIDFDLENFNANLQFYFRENVEPIYRELINLLLPFQENVSQERLKEALWVMDSLQLAEIENFIECQVQPVANKLEIEELEEVFSKFDATNAALIYPIILGERIEVIIYLPQQGILRYSHLINKEKAEETIEQLRKNLFDKTQPNPETYILPNAQKIYQWLLADAEEEIAKSQIKTLVFVLEDSLRNIPIAALHDSGQYLIQKGYGIVLLPSLRLLETDPLERNELTALAAGLTEPRNGFSPLPYVENELSGIKEVLKDTEQPLLNQEFTEKNLHNQLKNSSQAIVHLATHGKFHSNPEETFILTGNNKIKVKELDEFLRSQTRTRKEKIELFVLSACETAQGNKRAALGLAGVAVKTGAKTTLATLWQVADESTAMLMIEFYKKLVSEEEVSIAEALRSVQQIWLENENKDGNDWSHPYYWSPFVLVGNWQ
ncbi:CHAT domain-containing protein [Oscillatoria salina]|uniref:CHAT domain-containing protein n=1 Tax=Oscillatoria salina TaxID=331517 RepID=UPI0013B871F6|nr:CHAT domain-containing protein [Oscillatoria salina]MBZ8180947.1 CHAT domain-containing protein [Oscillatoria salina IIICB1]NET87896.1 CHAT domain-containing protein [Kamptonema sp. SIO1D9]